MLATTLGFCFQSLNHQRGMKKWLPRLPLVLFLMEFPKSFFDLLGIKHGDRCGAVHAARGFVHVYDCATIRAVERGEVGFQFLDFFWGQAPDKVFFPEELKERNESPMLLSAGEVVKLGIPLTISCVRESSTTPRTRQVFR